MSGCLSWWEIELIADGQAGGPEAESHLGVCQRCRQRVEWARRLRRAAAELAVRQPADGPEGLAAAVARAPAVGRISCRRARRLAAAYADGVLDEKLRPALECHLFTCEACYRAYRELVEVREALRAAAAFEPGPGLRERVHAAVAAEASAAVGPRRRAPLAWSLAAAAAAVVLALVAGLWLATKPGAPPGTEISPVVRVAAGGVELAPAPVPPARPQAPRADEARVTRPQPAPAAGSSAQVRRGVARGRRSPGRPAVAVARRVTRPRPMPAEKERPGGQAPATRVVEGAAVAEAPPAVAAAEPAIAAGAVGRPTVAPPTVAGSMSLHAAVPEVVPRPAAPVPSGAGKAGPAAEPEATEVPATSVAERPAGPPVPAEGSQAEIAEAAGERPEDATAEPEDTAVEPVRVAEAPPRPAMRWLPVRPAPTTEVVVAAASDTRRQLDELERRLNERLHEDDLAARKGWIVIK